MMEYPVPRTRRMMTLPTTMEEGKGEEGDMVAIPRLEATWEEAPESVTKSEELRGGGRDRQVRVWHHALCMSACK